jgi:hypothetical protein
MFSNCRHMRLAYSRVFLQLLNFNIAQYILSICASYLEFILTLNFYNTTTTKVRMQALNITSAYAEHMLTCILNHSTHTEICLACPYRPQTSINPWWLAPPTHLSVATTMVSIYTTPHEHMLRLYCRCDININGG